MEGEVKNHDEGAPNQGERTYENDHDDHKYVEKINDTQGKWGNALKNLNILENDQTKDEKRKRKMTEIQYDKNLMKKSDLIENNLNDAMIKIKNENEVNDTYY